MAQPLEVDSESPWLQFAADRAASARFYSERSDVLRGDFREAQLESYESYVQWEDEPHRITANADSNIFRLRPTQALKQFYDIQKQTIETQLSYAAGTTLSFPSKQILPLDWFGGEEVILYFKEEAGIWKVYQHGWQEDILLYLWSHTGQQLGPTLRIGGEPIRLPITNPEEVHLIEVGLVTQ